MQHFYRAGVEGLLIWFEIVLKLVEFLWVNLLVRLTPAQIKVLDING